MSANTKNEEENIIEEYPCEEYDGPLAPLINMTHPVDRKRIQVGATKMIFPEVFPKWQKRHANFKTKPTDVWVVSLAKTGTTWTQELTWCVLFGLNSPLKDEVLMKRFPFFEWDAIINAALMGELASDDPCSDGETWRILNNELKDPRTIKSHLSKQLLPRDIWKSGAKIIYVCRDPRDVCVSFYFHYMKFEGFIGNFEEFTELFLAGLQLFLPFWEHLLEFWKIRDRENVLFIRYEELQEDLPKIIRLVSEFLGKETSAEDIDQYVRHLSFDSMKKNKSTNNESIKFIQSEKSADIKFMRKGKVGDWKNHMDEKMIKKFKIWTESHLKNSDFPYYRDY